MASQNEDSIVKGYTEYLTANTFQSATPLSCNQQPQLLDSFSFSNLNSEHDWQQTLFLHNNYFYLETLGRFAEELD